MNHADHGVPHGTPQLAALQRLAIRFGKRWKHSVRSAWETGLAEIEADADHIAQLKSMFGTAWLETFELPPFDLDALPAAARNIGPARPIRRTAYHGTNVRFDRFIPSKSGAQGPGIYLADRPSSAAEYGSLIVQVSVDLANPYYFYPSDESLNAEINPELIERTLTPRQAMLVADRLADEGYDGYGFEVQNALRSYGYDSIVMVYPCGTTPVIPGLSGECVIVVFDNTQVAMKDVQRSDWSGWTSVAATDE
ncbi:hypothetical protein [Paraburkholderia sp. SIMBA_054]|uniref:ADP-ribosyltransferase-containing protein n=1 Tax=Paraburkholderia sp. SIMBA_054 TaxID=3085795 RepID=UPI00397B6A05